MYPSCKPPGATGTAAEEPGATGFGAFVFVRAPHPVSRTSKAARSTSKTLEFQGEVISFPITRKMESSCGFGRIIANEVRKSHEIVCARAQAIVASHAHRGNYSISR